MMRAPSFSWTRCSSRLCSSIALYIFTGALTSPKAMVPDQIARGILHGYPAAEWPQTSQIDTLC